ncbi:ABC-F family ATP-binding cassette domain-containing protein [Paracoccaceae bacterium GXU_MW_L88]
MAQPPLLTLTDISLTHGGNPLFSGLSLVIEPGARICLVGRNGSGKSTLMKIMAGLVQADEGTRFVQPGTSVAYMDQDPDLSGYAQLFDYVAEGLPVEAHYQAEMALEGVALDGTLDPAKASGGERRRSALARLLAQDADLMLLDEPTNHLDIRLIAWLEDHLKSTRKAFVLISHDRAFLRELTNRTLWVDRGQVRSAPHGFDGFEDWRDKVFEEEDQQRHKLDRLIKSEGKWAVEGISARRKRNQGRVRRLQDLRSERASQIRRAGPAAMALESGPNSGKLVSEATGISKDFGGKPIVKDFDLRIMRGDRVALIGPNGVGKTTLLKMLTGELAPDAGHIRLGTNLVPAVFDQTRAQLLGEKSLWENLTDDAELGISGKNDQILVRGKPKHVVGYLKEFLFDERQARGPVSALSGGERARLLLAKIMAKESNLLVLDEPTNDLDVETLDLLQELIDAYDGTVMLVSHDRDFLDRVASTSIAMEGDGRATVYAGGWSDYRAMKPKEAAPAPEKTAPKAEVKSRSKSTVSKLSYKQEKRLQDLPKEMSRLEAEIAKLEELLADPDLYAREPVKFKKATEALEERQEKLAASEEEWLEIEMEREALEG